MHREMTFLSNRSCTYAYIQMYVECLNVNLLQLNRNIFGSSSLCLDLFWFCFFFPSYGMCYLLLLNATATSRLLPSAIRCHSLTPDAIDCQWLWNLVSFSQLQSATVSLYKHNCTPNWQPDRLPFDPDSLEPVALCSFRVNEKVKGSLSDR